MAGTSHSLRGDGWWVRRDPCHWFPIHDHTIDAVEHPDRFGLDRRTLDRLVRLHGGSPMRESVRDAVIPWICRQGFIRVRLSRGRLGWQFFRNPDAALAVLRRFARRRELSPLVEVVFTDFATRRSTIASLGLLLDGVPASRGTSRV